DFEIASETTPEWALVVERATDDGRFYGFPKAFIHEGQEVASGPEAAWVKFNEYHPAALERVARLEHLSKKELGRIRDRRNDASPQGAKAEKRPGSSPADVEAARAEERRVIESTAADEKRVKEEIASLEAENAKSQLKMETADGQEKLLPVSVIVR